MKRRDALKAVGVLGGGLAVAAVAGPLDADDSGRLLAALADPERNLSERVIWLLERDDATAQRHDRSPAISTRVRHARQHLQAARQLRSAAIRPDWQQRLAVVEAQSARLAGRLAAFWLGDHVIAATAYRTALAASADTGPHAATLRAYVLGGMAFLDSQVGDRRAAVGTVTQALVVAESSQIRGLRAWLASTAAVVHAGVGDRRACADALCQAEDLFALHGPDDPPWADAFTYGLLLEDRASCLLRIGQPQQALDTLDAAERLVAPHRQSRRAVILGHRAEALVAAGEFTAGSQVATDALDLAARVGYGRVINQVSTLRRDHHVGRGHRVPRSASRSATIPAGSTP